MSHIPPDKTHIVTEVPQFSVKYKDIFHFRNLYVMMHELLWEEGWLTREGLGDRWQEALETLYYENHFQKGIHAGGKEVWVWWRCEKGTEGLGRGVGYFRWLLDIDIQGAYIKDVEIIHQGKKIKAQHGQLWIWFRPKIEGDYEKTWRKHPLLKHLQHSYEHRFMHGQVEKYEKMLWRDAYKIQHKIKAFLKNRTFIPISAPFHPRQYGHAENFEK